MSRDKGKDKRRKPALTYKGENVVGMRVGSLVILTALQPRKAGSYNTRNRVLCQCDCGNRIEVPLAYLFRKGNPKTHCGCQSSCGTHAVQKYVPEYRSWRMMLERCYNPKHISYKEYGGRGIRVQHDWLADFSKFLSDMGLRPTPNHSLDRIDPDGNYTKENCRWATAKEQANNQRRHKKT